LISKYFLTNLIRGLVKREAVEILLAIVAGVTTKSLGKSKL